MATTKNLDHLTSAVPDFIATLADAAAARDKKSNRPSTMAMVNALVQAEKAAKQQRLTSPLESLLGNWRLCFTAPRKPHLKSGTAVGKGFYIPKVAKAQISFSQVPISGGSLGIEISNSLQLSSLLFKLTGPAHYLGKKNLLAFDFTRMQISLFGRAVYGGEFQGGTKATDFCEQPIAKLPFFAFFLVTEDFIAARGRGGGIALWVKD